MICLMMKLMLIVIKEVRYSLELTARTIQEKITLQSWLRFKDSLELSSMNNVLLFQKILLNLKENQLFNQESTYGNLWLFLKINQFSLTVVLMKRPFKQSEILKNLEIITLIWQLKIRLKIKDQTDKVSMTQWICWTVFKKKKTKILNRLMEEGQIIKKLMFNFKIR